MANVLAREDNVRIAILGGGGMGKTSTALHILHHSAVKARYGEVRYFVGCDSVTSGGALALLILQIIQHKIAPNENSLDVLYRALSRRSVERYHLLPTWEVSTCHIHVSSS